MVRSKAQYDLFTRIANGEYHSSISQEKATEWLSNANRDELEDRLTAPPVISKVQNFHPSRKKRTSSGFRFKPLRY